MYLLVLLSLFISFSFAQDTIPQTDLPQTTPDTSTDEISELKKKVRELSDVSDEHSELLKRQIKDSHFDQSSRGYLEFKFGRTKINPSDVEDENDETFDQLDDANWEKFDYANIIELEIGKAVIDGNETRHEFGIGYQHLRSKRLQASFTPSGGGNLAKVTESIIVHTIFARYAMLFKNSKDNRFHFGPGVTVGFAPVSELLVDIEQDDGGSQIKGENTSYLVEIFGKAKYEITRYFYLVASAGYRKQKANNIKLTDSDVVNVKSTIDLDVSGFYGLFGLAASF